MQNFIQSSLLKDETVTLKGHRHGIVFLQPSVWLSLALVASFISADLYKLIIVFLILAVLTCALAVVSFFMTEIAVTNQRVLIKTGFFQKRTLETPLENIASVAVSQNFLGRVCDYGSVVIHDVGNNTLALNFIDNPFGLRKAVMGDQEQKQQQEK
jgi:uncharacterized membrane protein YdbT with pleckstrin-like domain